MYSHFSTLSKFKDAWMTSCRQWSRDPIIMQPLRFCRQIIIPTKSPNMAAVTVQEKSCVHLSALGVEKYPHCNVKVNYNVGRSRQIDKMGKNVAGLRKPNDLVRYAFRSFIPHHFCSNVGTQNRTCRRINDWHSAYHGRAHVLIIVTEFAHVLSKFPSTDRVRLGACGWPLRPHPRCSSISRS